MQVTDPNQFCEIHRAIFNLGDIQTRRFKTTIETPMNAVENAFFHISDQAIGAVAWCPQDRIGYIHSIGVMEAARGQGLGREMAVHCTAYLQEKGCETIYVIIASDNPVSLKIHEKLGFEIYDSKEIWMKD